MIPPVHAPPASLRWRSRAIYAAFALGIIGLGLTVHLGRGPLGAGLRDFIGDALWGAMIACWIGAIAPRASRSGRAAVALAVCTCVEFSQLYHTPALDAVRSTLMGRLVLGSGFDPRDLAAYTAGVLAAALIERGRAAYRFDAV